MHDAILRQIAEARGKKVTREAFIYLDPTGDKKKFAQCETCAMWRKEEERCAILGKAKKVDADDSCNFYVQGAPNSLPILDPAPVTPEQAGFVDRQVRCENCGAFDAARGVCAAYEAINKALPDNFDLDPKVDPQGCCNANHPK